MKDPKKLNYGHLLNDKQAISFVEAFYVLDGVEQVNVLFDLVFAVDDQEIHRRDHYIDRLAALSVVQSLSNGKKQLEKKATHSNTNTAQTSHFDDSWLLLNKKREYLERIQRFVKLKFWNKAIFGYIFFIVNANYIHLYSFNK